jgi:hypothetical protein
LPVLAWAESSNITAVPLHHLRVSALLDGQHGQQLVPSFRACWPRGVTEVLADVPANTLYVKAVDAQAVRQFTAIVTALDASNPKMTLAVTAFDLPVAEAVKLLGNTTTGSRTPLLSAHARQTLDQLVRLQAATRSVLPEVTTSHRGRQDPPLTCRLSAEQTLAITDCWSTPNGGVQLTGTLQPAGQHLRLFVTEGDMVLLAAQQQGTTDRETLYCLSSHIAAVPSTSLATTTPATSTVVECLPIEYLDPNDMANALADAGGPVGKMGILRAFVPRGIQRIYPLLELHSLLVIADNTQAIEQLSDFLRMLDQPETPVQIKTDFVKFSASAAGTLGQPLTVRGSAYDDTNVTTLVIPPATDTLQTLLQSGKAMITDTRALTIAGGHAGCITFPDTAPYQGLWIDSLLVHPDHSVTLHLTMVKRQESDQSTDILVRVKSGGSIAIGTCTDEDAPGERMVIMTLLTPTVLDDGETAAGKP